MIISVTLARCFLNAANTDTGYGECGIENFL